MFVSRLTLLNDNGVQAELHFCTLHNSFLNCIFRDESEHAHLFLLTNPVGTILNREDPVKMN